VVGVIAKIVSDRGFGFIKGEDGQQRFFHHTAVVKPAVFALLEEGQQVEFLTNDKRPGERGPRAEQVRLFDVDTPTAPEPVKPNELIRIEEEGRRCTICPERAVALVHSFPVCDWHILHGEGESCNTCGRGPVIRDSKCVVCLM